MNSATQRTWIYIDGFNLYYGSVFDTPYKWLDLVQLCRNLLPKNDVQHVKYFTAKVNGDGDLNRIDRQEIYWRALRHSGIEIIEGPFRCDAKRMPLAYYGNDHIPNKRTAQLAYVMRTEEKGSDVNLAAHLVNDACHGVFDVAVVVSNDSDFKEAIRLVRGEIGKTVGVINPSCRKRSKSRGSALHSVASFWLGIEEWELRKAQLPACIPGTNITKPKAWE